MENNYRIGVKKRLHSFCVVLPAFLFCSGGPSSFETEVTVSMHRKKLRMDNIYPRPAPCGHFGVSCPVEFHPSVLREWLLLVLHWQSVSERVHGLTPARGWGLPADASSARQPCSPCSRLPTRRSGSGVDGASGGRAELLWQNPVFSTL